LLNFPSVGSEGFQLNAVCVQKFSLILFVQLRSKRHKIRVSSVAILAELLLNLAGFLSVSFNIFNLAVSWFSSRVLPTAW